MEKVINKEKFNDLKTLLQQECKKITSSKQANIDEGQFEIALKFREVEKKLLDLIKTLEKE